MSDEKALVCSCCGLSLEGTIEESPFGGKHLCGLCAALLYVSMRPYCPTSASDPALLVWVDERPWKAVR